jgi:hypothetical protein
MPRIATESDTSVDEQLAIPIPAASTTNRRSAPCCVPFSRMRAMPSWKLPTAGRCWSCCPFELSHLLALAATFIGRP